MNSTLATLCAVVLAGCAFMRDHDPDRIADWDSIAARTRTLAQAECIELPEFSVNDFVECSKTTGRTPAKYLDIQGRGMPSVCGKSWRLADEIANTITGTLDRARASRLGPLDWAGTHIADWVNRAMDFGYSDEIVLELEQEIKASRSDRVRLGREIYEGIGKTIVVLHVGEGEMLVRDASGQASLVGHQTKCRCIDGGSLARELGIAVFVDPPRPADLPTSAQLREANKTKGRPSIAKARSDIGHTCHARNCNAPCPREHLMCAHHWGMVPLPLQRAVWAHYRQGQCDDMQFSQAWEEAADAAISSVAEQEQNTRPRPLHSTVAREKPVTQILWLDTETTGRDAKRNQIIEVAAAITDMEGTILGPPDVALKEPAAILIAIEPWAEHDTGAIAIHGIDWTSKTYRGSKMRDVFERLFVHFEGRIVGGHQPSFDMRFFRENASRVDLSYPREIEDKTPVIDTLSMAQRLKRSGLLKVEACSLRVLTTHFGIAHTAHRALGDTLACIEIYKRLRAIEQQHSLLKTG